MRRRAVPTGYVTDAAAPRGQRYRIGIRDATRDCQPRLDVGVIGHYIGAN